ncbi:Transcriptional regulator, AraC family [Labilithrix luteola]|uniref:Transcriptional regulator, AraC family n=1 Tax=Labilithrix luteola TaxID=1391654 RepID=A0A0K1QFQ3_9BACT|nr:AraC family transcriptional regulator [Labilithrix luteola]AKV04487.1 Transcriptional regulator, AraC family [Labilithrix luteola]
MKKETRSFYEEIVQQAVGRIVHGLDEALDLGCLARGAALSPLHFHRIFRGIVGETPLELHRRLRLERAAHRLANGGASVTSIAFDAGYETHESFTRAFRDAYAASPSEFRERAAEERSACRRPPDVELAARCGIHFIEGKRLELPISIQPTGAAIMNVDIQTMPELRVAAVSHRGPYNTISNAFERLGGIVGPAGLIGLPGCKMLAIYHDDPETTPATELRADAGIVVPNDVALPPGLTEIKIPAGKYARTEHVGPYTLLGDTWSRLMGEWLPKSGHRINGMMYEVYKNTPMDTKPSDLLTELFLNIA